MGRPGQTRQVSQPGVETAGPDGADGTAGVDGTAKPANTATEETTRTESVETESGTADD